MPMVHGLGLMATVGPALGSGGGVICPAGYDQATFREIVRTLAPTWLMAVPPVLQSILDDAVAIRAGGRPRLRFVRAGSGQPRPRAGGGDRGAVRYRRAGQLRAVRGRAGVLAAAAAAAAQAGNGRGADGLGGRRDRRRRPAARAGADGEVVVRGDDVFAGYLDDPAATEKAFIDGWFRTGDLGSFDADGYLVLDGRLKDMINRGGEKIAPTEVEAAIYRHPRCARPARSPCRTRPWARK